ncbi:MAG: phosphoribosylamine--glycine ligase [Bacteroidales bacterium]|nr:phosphoribosylamine--glycine ligase [Bacteroidales bacterium]MBR1950679.1 phosphoribosylamine--glycine ligase [Bacteroidales bacterium]
MNVLVLGSGGREHAIAWKVKQSEKCTNLYCLPGNPGTAQIATNVSGGVKDFDAIKRCVLENGIDIVIVGPEDPLVFGLKDMFAEDPQLKDVLFVGPSKKGAQLEGSKDFAKEFMTRHNIPTAAYRSFTKETLEEADAFLATLEAPYVLKADGLAAGKGVLIIDSLEEAKAELRNMMGGKFGAAGNTVVIEQFLKGIEVSVFVLTSGKDYLILPEAKDYKRIGEGDKGLNTGGMGAVSPVVFADAQFMQKVEERIIKPTVEGFRKDDIDYKGFIFIGLMNCGGDPYVIEYNVRMGDPETEAVMTRIDSDLLSHLVAAAKGDLSGEKMEISKDGALTVVCVSGGYPEEYKKGLEMGGSRYLYENAPDSKIKVFHSGTAMKDGKLVTNGGRVLAVTVNGNGIEAQRSEIYAEIEKIGYEGKYFRRDVGLDLLNYKG